MWAKKNNSHMPYIFATSNINPSTSAAFSFGSFYILLNELIPMALIIILELSKIFYTINVQADADMF